MPPKKRAATESAEAASSSKQGARQSKLAKEHNITAQDEAEFREAFSLFAEARRGEKEGVMPVGDVRRAMIALGLPPSNRTELRELISVLDPEDEGFVSYAPFVAVCALKLHARDDLAGSAAARQRRRDEVDEAFRLFTNAAAAAAGERKQQQKEAGEESILDLATGGGGGGSGAGGGEPRITLAHLKRVAALLKHGEGDDEAATDALLRDMILEANGGAGVGKGVTKAEFEEVMRRAGVWR